MFQTIETGLKPTESGIDARDYWPYMFQKTKYTTLGLKFCVTVNVVVVVVR